MVRAILCPNEPLPTTGAAVVVDVIRATTTAVAFFEAGANEVWFAPDHRSALALRSHGFVTAGETGGRRPPGFDLGNSPREARRSQVAGQRVVMSTTNGTRAAHRAAERTSRVALGSLWNLEAVARWAKKQRPLLLVAAGKEGLPGLDDTYVIGALADLIGGQGDDLAIARAILARYRLPKEALLASAAARALAAIGLEEDVDEAARVNESTLVPILDRREGPYLVFRRSAP